MKAFHIKTLFFFAAHSSQEMCNHTAETGYKADQYGEPSNPKDT